MTIRTKRWVLAIITFALAMVNEMYYVEIVQVIGPTLERFIVIGLGLVCFSAIVPEILDFED